MEDGHGWDHMFSSSYQFGGMALVAPGQADKTAWGATPRSPATLPEALPRWDDTRVAVISLAEQQGDIFYRLADGSLPKPNARPSQVTILRSAPPPPAANIAAAFGMGAAFAQAKLEAVLRGLGLVENATWTEAAELVFWRLQPAAWQMHVTTDPRYAASLEQTLKTIPATIATDPQALLTITAADIDATLAQHPAARADVLRNFGPNARQHPQPTPEQAQQSLVFRRRHDLDWLFFRHWRLPEGWLSGSEAKRALEIFHDPLAIAMRKSVVARLYPDQTLFAQ